MSYPDSFTVIYIVVKGKHIFQKLWRHFEIVDAKSVIWSSFQSDDPWVLGVVVQISIANGIWCPGFVYPWL